MQPYRTVGGKPGSGPQDQRHLCQNDGCDAIAEIQIRRHATAAEYDAIGENHKPIDGVAHMAVFVCADHEPDPICSGADHFGPDATPPQQGTCPVCKAVADDPCRKPNGSPRSLPHPARGATALSSLPICTHVHREDCGGIDHCRCSRDDPAPRRGSRGVAAA